MKAANLIIIALIAALAFSTYLLAQKIMPKSASPEPAPAPVAAEKQPAPVQAPAALHQPLPQANGPVPPPPILRQEAPVAQTQPAPPPPAKEEPKLRPARDIKVVMYMTDW